MSYSTENVSIQNVPIGDWKERNELTQSHLEKGR